MDFSCIKALKNATAQATKLLFFWLPDNVETLGQRHRVSSGRGGSYHERVEPRPHDESHQEVHAPLNPRGQAVSLSTNYSHPR